VHHQLGLGDVDPLDEQLDDLPAVLPGTAFEPPLQALLEPTKLVDDMLSSLRLLVLLLEARDVGLALVLALLETLAPCFQLLQPDGTRLVGVHQALDGLCQGAHLPREPALLHGVRIERSADLVALGFELGSELLGFQQPARQVFPHRVLDIVCAHG
jgi:hypothetical protein